MQLGTFITLYLISIPLFVVGDLLWLGVVAKNLYQSNLNHLLGDVQWVPAIIFYFLFLGGLTFFATYPAIGGTVYRALLLGALFGFMTYATYDLTNHATLRNWPAIITVVDILWGTFLGAAVSAGAYYIYTNFL